MKRLVRRAAVAAVLALPLVAAGGVAHAEDPTCVGTSSTTIVCDPYVTYGVPVDVEPYTHTETVCYVVGCQPVEVTLARVVPGEPLDVCVGWYDRVGNRTQNCVSTVLLEHVDPTLCEVLKLLAPGVAGILDITAEGDAYVLGEFVWDCFPYAT